MKDLDLVTIGRSSVDLYGQQIGGRLEDMASFVKAVGGCPANIAVGAARLGLKSALISRVGDEAMGRFIREQLMREGVCVDGLATDPERLTALVLLGVRDENSFPLIFYRTDCADAALDESDISRALIARAQAVLVTGTHFARANSDAAQKKAIHLARETGAKVIFDIDYRPNLWGLAGHGAGDSRYVASDQVSAHLAEILPDCDLIVGTEEELHIAGGSADTLTALKAIRRLAPGALIVAKRGAEGCVAFPKAIPATLEEGIRGPGFPVEVYNVLGAGDAFMAGFLSGWLRDEPLETCCTYANACGAIAVSRLLCAPEYPGTTELRHFLEKGSSHHALRFDPVLNHLHHAATRWPMPPRLAILSIDHGLEDFEQFGKGQGADPGRIAFFKTLAVKAAAEAAEQLSGSGGLGVGMFLEGTLGREALFRAEDHSFWITRQVPHGARTRLTEWPARQVAKLIANGRSDARTPIGRHLAEIQQVLAAAQVLGREVLIEALPPEGETTAMMLQRLYAEGLKPDYWLIELQHDAPAWAAIDGVIEAQDPHCRGVIVIARNSQSGPDLRKAGKQPRVIGFVGGRSVFGSAFRLWLDGNVDDEAAVTLMRKQLLHFAADFTGDP
jgi:5-dehydro-2-deoxygluconokinase